MKLSDFNYNLPKELIAQKPVKPRDHSRLMVLDKKTKAIKHDFFYNLPKYLKPGDVLVFNNTKVFPARLIGKRDKTGGKVEIFLLKKFQEPKIQRAKQIKRTKIKKYEYWEVLIGNKKKKPGEKIIFSKNLFCKIIKRADESVWLVRFNKTGVALQRLIDKLGQVPLPPYIKTEDQRLTTKKLKEEYQTVYAKYRGSVAAPTAGFHFTKDLLKKIKKAGMQTEFVTLHVGFGTFQPVKVKNITKHQIHAEWASLDQQTAKRLNQAKIQGRRIIAVGTTTVRTLEAFSLKNQKSKGPKNQTITKIKNQKFKLKPQNKWINTFIYPGYKFKFIDGMITNFHLPKSTLLMLVSAFASAYVQTSADKKAPADRSAFAGLGKILQAYEIAKRKKYRFYSFGDGMLII